jgi:LacI family transcriptional regulator
MERSRAAKYQIVMQPCDYNANSLCEDVCRSVRQSRCDGVILTPPLSDLSAVTEAIESLDIPFVKIAPGKHTDTYRSVCTNDRESCASMTEQLAALGHQRIGFIIGSPTAIFASNDEMAAGALTVAHSLGLGVPEDISVVGFDDAPLASQVWPALTTIRQPIADMAAQAAQLLLSTLSGEPADHATHVLPSSLVYRQSTGPAPNRLRHPRSRSEGRGLKRAS